MKCLERNKQDFYYALYKTSEDIEDEYGNLTGEAKPVYEKPEKYSANISAAVGEAVARQFGNDLHYDRVIVIADKNHPAISETTILWIDTVPSLDVNGELEKDELGNIVTPYDYVVTECAESLNSISIAISKVKVK